MVRPQRSSFAKKRKEKIWGFLGAVFSGPGSGESFERVYQGGTAALRTGHGGEGTAETLQTEGRKGAQRSRRKKFTTEARRHGGSSGKGKEQIFTDVTKFRKV